MANGHVVRTQPFTGGFLSVQHPDESTAVLSTVVPATQTDYDRITLRFVDTYTGVAKGDNLTFVGFNEDYVVTFGKQGHTVVTYTTRPDGVSYAAVFNYIDGEQLHPAVRLPGEFAQSETLSHTTFLFDQYQGSPNTAIIVTRTDINNVTKTILTTIDLNTGADFDTEEINGRVHSIQTDPTGEHVYVITEKRNTTNIVTSTTLTVLDTATGDPLAAPLTYTGQHDTLVFNPDHTRALLTYYDFATGAPRAVIINTNTATQTGPIINLPGGFTDTILINGDSTRAAILTSGTPPKGTPTTTLTTINLGNGTIASSLGLAGLFDSVRYNADGSRALVITKETTTLGGYTTVTSQTVVLVDTATDTAIGTPLTITGEIFNIELGELRGGIISTSTSGPGQTTTLTTLDMANGHVVRTQPFTGGFLSVQHPDESTAVLSTVVPATQTDYDRITLRFVDTYTGVAKGDNLTFVGFNEDYVVTFGKQGHTVVTYTTRPDGVSYAAVFNYIDGEQLHPAVRLPGEFAQSETLSHTTFLFDQYQGSPNTAIIVTRTDINNVTKTILTTIDLNTGADFDTEEINGRVHSIQTDPTGEHVYVITQKRNTTNIVTSTTLTVLDTATGDPLAAPLTYTGQHDTLVFNPDHTRARLTYYDFATGAPRAVIINTNTATQTGPIINLPGGFTDTILINGDSTRAAILTSGTPPKGTPTTTLTTINLGHDLMV